jgi:hypothetical protein
MNAPINVQLQLNAIDVKNLLSLLQRAGYENMEEAEVGVVLKQSITRQLQNAIIDDTAAKEKAKAKSDTVKKTKPAKVASRKKRS